MSIQDCIICDQCGKHEKRPDTRLAPHLGLENMMPVGWWTFKPEGDFIEWKVFCSSKCVTYYLVGESPLIDGPPKRTVR